MSYLISQASGKMSRSTYIAAHRLVSELAETLVLQLMTVRLELKGEVQDQFTTFDCLRDPAVREKQTELL